MFFKKIISAAAAAAVLLTAAVTANAETVSTRDFSQYRSEYASANLTQSERELYNRLDDAANRLLTSSENAGYNLKYRLYHTEYVLFSDLSLSTDEAYDVAFWFKINNPQYYFLAETNLTQKTSSRRGVEERIAITIFDFAANGKERAKITDSLFGIVDEWVESVTDDEVTTYQKELAINDLIIDKLNFDSNAPYNQSAYSAVMNGSTVCAGYSAAFSLLCNAAGIDCLTVSSMNHAWNIVKLDNEKWYTVDSTWNDSAGIKTYIFNLGEKNVSAKSNGNEHVYDSYSAKWMPAVSTVDYTVTEYDKTGTGSNLYALPKFQRQLAAADVNNDGYINSKDATEILKMAVGLSPKNGLLGDVNNDGSVNSKDATEILKYAVGLPSALDNI